MLNNARLLNKAALLEEHCGSPVSLSVSGLIKPMLVN